MSGGEIIIGLGIGAALIASGVWFLKEDRRGRGLDTGLDDWLPEEAKRPGGIGSGGGRNETHRVETHEGSPCRTDRRGAV